MKRPAFQFYPSDWRADAALQSCSIGARGLWHELLCIMHDCIPYGHLELNGVPMDEVQIARLARLPLAEYRKLLQEIERFGVSSRTTDGVIFSRRMVKDERLRCVRAAGGERGAEHGPKGAEHGSKGGRPKSQEPPLKPPLVGAPEPPLEPPLKPPPSSSSSSSSSTSKIKSKSTRAKRPPACTLPDGFGISDRVRTWAQAKGYVRLAERLEQFIGRARAKGYTYVDWDEAFMEAIRADWAGLNVPVRPLDRREQRASNMDRLTGKARPNERIIDVASGVGGATVLPLPGGVREPGGDDVGGSRSGGGQSSVGAGSVQVRGTGHSAGASGDGYPVAILQLSANAL